jgi:hypothetical protein
MLKWLVTLFVVLFALGLLRPALTKIGLGRLPGDVEVQHRGRKFYFPFATSVIFSLVIMLVLWVT